jgi:(2Fe-2S) ferredoxin
MERSGIPASSGTAHAGIPLRFIPAYDYQLPTVTAMSHYKHHVFFCCNQREGHVCCNSHGASAMKDYAKDRIDALGLKGKGKVRINSAGCLDRCEVGPTLVIYPEAVWYTYANKRDIDEIIDSHLVNGRVVERLKV